LSIARDQIRDFKSFFFNIYHSLSLSSCHRISNKLY